MIKFPKRKNFEFCVLVIRICLEFRISCFEFKLSPYDFIHWKSNIEALDKEGVLFDEVAPLFHLIAH
jgi:hypothetical protein